MKFSYFEFNVSTDKSGYKPGIFVGYKKLESRPVPNGFKIWKEEGENLPEFIGRIKSNINWLREYPR